MSWNARSEPCTTFTRNVKMPLVLIDPRLEHGDIAGFHLLLQCGVHVFILVHPDDGAPGTAELGVRPDRTRAFHHVHVPRVELEEGSIVGLDWLTAEEARQRWQRKELKLSTPVAFVLHHLAKMEWQAALPWLHKTPGHNYEKPNRFELRRGIHLIPVRTATLPPATHTNCVIIGEDDRSPETARAAFP